LIRLSAATRVGNADISLGIVTRSGTIDAGASAAVTGHSRGPPHPRGHLQDLEADPNQKGKDHHQGKRGQIQEIKSQGIRDQDQEIVEGQGHEIVEGQGHGIVGGRGHEIVGGQGIEGDQGQKIVRGQGQGNDGGQDPGNDGGQDPEIVKAQSQGTAKGRKNVLGQSRGRDVVLGLEINRGRNQEIVTLKTINHLRRRRGQTLKIEKRMMIESQKIGSLGLENLRNRRRVILRIEEMNRKVVDLEKGPENLKREKLKIKTMNQRNLMMVMEIKTWLMKVNPMVILR